MLPARHSSAIFIRLPHETYLRFETAPVPSPIDLPLSGERGMKQISRFIGALAAATLVASCGGGDSGTSTSVAGGNVAMAVNATTGAVITQSFSGDPFTFAAGVNAGGMVVPGPAVLTITDSGGGAQTFNISGNGGVTAAGGMSFGSCKFTITASSVPGVVIGTTYTITACSLALSSSGTKIGEPVTIDAVFDLGGSKAEPKKKTILIRTDGTVALLVGGKTIDLPSVKVSVQTVTGT
jgi:hypothetical protein